MLYRRYHPLHTPTQWQNFCKCRPTNWYFDSSWASRAGAQSLCRCARQPSQGCYRSLLSVGRPTSPPWITAAAGRRRRRPQTATQVLILLALQNPTDERIAFKVKTTAPAKYSVRLAIPIQSVRPCCGASAGTPCRHLLAAAPACRPPHSHLARFLAFYPHAGQACGGGAGATGQRPAGSDPQRPQAAARQAGRLPGGWLRPGGVAFLPAAKIAHSV